MARRLRTVHDRSVTGAILERAAATGSRLALRTPFGSFTGNELGTKVTEIAGSLRERCADTHTPLIIVMAGDPWTVAALLAADLVRRPAVLLHASSTAQDIQAAAVASGADLMLQHGGVQVKKVAAGTSNEIRHGVIWTDLPAHADYLTPRRVDERELDGLVCHGTSGTMGSSRLALRTRTAVLAEMETLRRVLAMTDGDVVLCGSAVSHSYGCVGGLLTPLLAGASLTIARNPEEAREAFVASEPSIVFGLGPMYAQIADSSVDLSRSLRKVRFAFSAGAPLASGLFERFRGQFGIPIRQDYGTSETGTISLDLAETPWPDSVGRILPHVEVGLRPPKAIPLEPGEEGEVLVCSESVALGYLMGGKLVPCVDERGWYRTQDAGSWVDSRLRIHRRLRALPSINGENVNLDALERAIARLPGVLEVRVAPETSFTGTSLVATVATSSRTVDEIRAWCSHVLPPNWRPDRIVICERLPRSPAGKILN